MSSITQRMLLTLGVSALAAGCTTTGAAWFPFTDSTVEYDPRAVSAASARSRRAAEAEALYQLGVAQADPISPLRDYRAARATFTQFVAEFPQSAHTVEARAWQATLTDLLAREDEARRAALRVKHLEEDSKRTKANLDWLKQTDLEQERRR
ncbi:MAG TPA: hypothetical protein VEH80_02400 [Candidatus Bathyarchaeia archaeon]|nr:hypothetical protein [Candidatus Bathyarchaeia archaeon]